MDKTPEVISLSPELLQDVLDDIVRVGLATDAADAAESLTSELKRRINYVEKTAALGSHKPTVLQLEWVDPLMCGGHWVVEMVELAGGIPVFGDKTLGSQVLSWEQVYRSDPDIILVIPCGFNLERSIKDLEVLCDYKGWDELSAVKNNRLFVVDAGSYTSRLGPRLITGLEIMAQIIHPELFSGYIPNGALKQILR